ncbi:MAG: molybdopterin-dependent oxidoreductase [Sphingomonadaceae bacterium]|nr:molybdopterin-dependent oxidoreductase [Sphingomonadaceae bacterium]
MTGPSPLGEGLGWGGKAVPEGEAPPPAPPVKATGIKTTCAYCGVGCGIVATPVGERRADIMGDPDHPANFGRLCSKGTHLGETIGLEGRLLQPEVYGQRVDWDTALQTVADRFAAIIAEHGPDSVAFYVSGQLLTEDYYVANKLMKGFIGSANIDTNSRLCMASAVAAYNRSFGEDLVPCTYADLEEADLVILVGSNTAWCHPVIWQRLEAARKARGTKIVVVDPRKTETAEQADLHLQIAPDGDVALFNEALLALKERGLVDEAFLAERVDVPEGFWSTVSEHRHAELASVSVAQPPEAEEKRTLSQVLGDGLTQDARESFINLLAAYPKTVTVFSMGVNQSVAGTDKGNAIINLHLATGRIGKPGMGPFSMTGQPNAMGGREVGGLANMLACHRGFSAVGLDWAQRFWSAPTICRKPGLKAVEMFNAVAEGKVKAIWIMATNPAVSMPDANAVRAALAACPFVVVSDCMSDTDTTAFAHVKLPALGWGEKDGTVTNSERVISRQRGFLKAAGDAKSDWWIMSEVAKRMGWEAAFDYASNASVFREYAAMTGFENDGLRVLNIADKARISDAGYDAMDPFIWGGDHALPKDRMKLVPVRYTPREGDDACYALRLNSGRYRDQWHTMTRTGLSPKLSQHRREPLVEVHPDMIARFGLDSGGLAEVKTARGKSIYRVLANSGQRRMDLFVPMHWTDQLSSGGRTGLLPTQDRDPFSGQPGFKNTPATIRPWQPEWRGFLITTGAAPRPDCSYWTKIRTASGWLIELAGDEPVETMAALLPEGLLSQVSDPTRGTLRAASIIDGKLAGALFVAHKGELPPRDWLIAQMGGEDASPMELLAGRPATQQVDRGPIICVCFDVGLNTLIHTIASEELTSVEAVGTALNAGSNCGSCRPAIARLLQRELEHAA